MEAETPDGIRHSVLLQNAETVRLIGPGKSAELALSACCKSPFDFVMTRNAEQSAGHSSAAQMQQAEL